MSNKFLVSLFEHLGLIMCIAAELKKCVRKTISTIYRNIYILFLTNQKFLTDITIYFYSIYKGYYKGLGSIVLTLSVILSKH